MAVWPLWRVLNRAGLPGAWALLALVPVVGLVLVFIVLSWYRWPLLPPRPRPLPPKRRRVA
ncbi:MAG: hypothetical protein GC191_19395 [Azospirillum sp.]|nr:hypothetical protein [Azospirillum sp.]